MIAKNLTAECSECNSLFYAPKSRMEAICPECAHHLYGHDNCNHSFHNGRCEACFWDGSESDYVKKLKTQNSSQKSLT